MGLHPSLKRGQKLGGERSVLKRSERIKRLLEEDKWEEGDSVLGLPKVKVVKMKAIKKEKPKENEEAAKDSETTEKQSKEEAGKKTPKE
ncbi:MAG: small basic protein [Candidatus Omnitrophica bacterium]|nr:small basic protein [Candidatus Omnitrophota bacterium]MCF7887700.1 small basic protein [Candidatus Omnitrophota bacterium]